MLLAHHTNTALQNCALCHILLACIVSQRQPHQSRSTGHGNAWTRPDSTRADEAPAPKRRQTERDTETAPTAEPPRDQAQKRTRQKNQSQHGSSSGDKTASRQPAPPKPQRSSQSQKSQKRGTVDHERRRAETESRRAEKRGNEEKTTVKRRFSPRLTERPADQPPEPAQHRQTRTAAEMPPFRFCFCGVCGTNGDQRLFCYLHRGGGFTFSRPQQCQKFGFVPSSPRLYLFHQTITSQTHRSSTIYFLTNINILCYSLLFGRMP